MEMGSKIDGKEGDDRLASMTIKTFNVGFDQ